MADDAKTGAAGDGGDKGGAAGAAKTDGGAGGAGDGKKDGQGSGDAGKGDGKDDKGTFLGGAGKKPGDEKGKEGDGKAADDKKGDEKGDGKQGAPEKYADFKLPEGLSLDKAAMDEFAGVAKALNLSQENAQKLVDLQAKIAKSGADAALSEFEKVTDAWRKATTDLFGSKSDEKRGHAAKAIERFGTPELRKLLDDSKMGDHPEIAKFFVKVGELISEDNPPNGKPGADGKKSDADAFYGPDYNKKVKAA